MYRYCSDIRILSRKKTRKTLEKFPTWGFQRKTGMEMVLSKVCLKIFVTYIKQIDNNHIVRNLN